MSQLLPPFPNLEHLRGQAKDVLRVVRRRKPEWKLADAQHAVARGYGFTNWPDLKTHVESVRRQPAASSVARQTHAGHERNGHDVHPIVGTWILNASRSTFHTTQLQNDGVMLEFGIAGGTVTMTQVVVDPSGHDVAVKLAIRTDGQQQPVRFGKGMALEARWTDSRALEAVVTSGAQIVSRGIYEVSEDGQSLAFTTPEHHVVFDRVGER